MSKRGIAIVVGLAALMVIVQALLSVGHTPRPAPSPSERPLQTGRQDTPATRSLPYVEAPMGRMGGLRPPMCPYEDGDPQVLPCVWQHPRTGLSYYVSSIEYTR